ncbi:unnamed protein product [Rhodiola kirilowii]
MECNKDEAVQAVNIALKKFNEDDILGAQRFALKAQKLFPELEGIQQFLDTLDVHVYATKVDGEMDWYAILSVNPAASDDMIKRSYRRMQLKMHPDKNKWDGAVEAFCLINEAYTVLSDKERRAAYEQKRKGKQVSEDTGVSTSTSVPFPSNNNDISRENAPNPPTAPSPTPTPKPKTQKAPSRSSSKKATTPLRKDTFWTVCPNCEFKYEYDRIYVNSKLVCHGSECGKIFIAFEISPPPGRRKSMKKQSVSENSPASCTDFSTPQVPSSSKKSTTSTPVSETVHAEHWKTTNSLKREAQASSTVGNPKKKQRKNGKEELKEIPLGNGGSVCVEMDKPGKTSVDVPHKEAHKMLKQISKEAIKKKLIEWNDVAAASSNKLQKDCSSDVNGRKLKGLSSLFAGGVNKGDLPTSSTNASNAMEVPDGDFHNFSDRSKWKFEKGQVWAVYDEQYGMPRLYATVDNVVSKRPFKVKLRWLDSRSNEEFETIRWIGSGFHKTSGVFHRGQPEEVNDKSCFSHIVNCKRGSGGVTHIYPKKGDVWAVFKNWSPDWDANVRSSPEVFNQYDIMEVLQDYTEKTGVTVAPLVKLPGFKSVMQRNSDPTSQVTIPKHEIFKLSHQVPFCPLTENNYPNAPSGCLEIDLAAVPYEFPQQS